jgi:hypothetical protein
MNTLAAATIVQRSTNTALAAASFTKTPTATPTDTPNAQQTVVAMVVLTDAAGTAIMIASYTKTPSLTATRTLTRVPPSPTIPPTATRTPTFTPLPPNLTASGSCTLSGQATFTVTNTGGDMTSAANYTITGPAGTVKSGTIQLKAGQSTTVSVQGVLGLLTFSANVGGVTISANTTCVESTKTPAPPSVTAQGTCTDQGASFTITNASGGDMTTADTYTVTDAKGNVLKSGTFQLKQGESLTVTVTGVTGVVTLKSSTTKLNVSIDCKPPTPRQHQASRCAAR